MEQSERHDLLQAIDVDAVALRRTVDVILQNSECDSRWAAIARTHFQQGFMALRRSVEGHDYPSERF